MKISIRKHMESDIPYRVKWLNNSKVNTFLWADPRKKTNKKKQKIWFEEYKKSRNKKFFTFLSWNKPIWFMWFSNYSKINRNSEIFIMIWEEEYLWKWIWEYCMKWLISYWFNSINLNKISLSVFEDNIPAVNLYKKIWFKVEGRLVDEVYFWWKYYTSLLMAIFNPNK